MSDLGSGRKAELSMDRLELLERMLEEEGLFDDAVDSADAILPRPSGEPAPLSFAQARLWFLDRWQRGSWAYNLFGAQRFTIPIEPRLLAASFNEVVRRHESLRTTFTEIDGKPVQSVAAQLRLPLREIDLGVLPRAIADGEERRALGACARRTFDLERGPLLATELLRREGAGSVLLATMHHIVSDGWSLAVLLREVLAIYRSLARGRSPRLPPIPIQYGDYAAWQRQRLSGERLEAEIAWWRARLFGAPTLLELPADRPRPAAQSFRGSVRPIRLDDRTADNLQALAQAAGATLFMALLAGFAVLLRRYTGQRDLLIGSPIANRNRPEVENLIGFFANTLVLRVRFAGEPGFRNLLAQVRDETFAAYEHQDIPFEKLVEELRLGRDPSRQPLCQVVFALQNARAETEVASNGPRPVAEALPIDNGSAKFDLLLSLAETAQGVQGGIEYSLDLFDAATIDRMAAHLDRLLGALALRPDRPAIEAPLLTTEEMRQISAWSEPRGKGRTFSLIERFAEQATTRPDAIAVSLASEQMTYGELLRQANELALRLAILGVAPGDLVGLCFERSTAMVVAILGTLQGGAAYVPLDPHYPQERLSFLLEDSGVGILLTQASLAERLPAHGARVITLDDLRSTCRGSGDSSSPPCQISPEFPAYVIYTSGSTGKPKGVVVSHANVARLFAATDAWFFFDERDVWTLFHSTAFDFSVWELWGALLHGGRLVVVPYWTSRTAEEFHELVVREGVTVLNQTPSAFRQFATVDEERAGAPFALRSVVFGGEALDLASLGPWFDRRGDERPRLVNMYGITETTVHVTHRELAAADIRGWVGTPIGKPIPDLSVRVLDPRGQVAPIGVPGELCIGGAGVALGYLGRPALTAERFVPDPAGETGGRLYRSGDLGRFRGDGEIEYLGRIDHQIKLHGFRIELGEIEAALLSCLGVRDAVAVLRDEMLIGYWVGPTEGTFPSSEELRKHLRDRLPEYMVPGRLVALESLPLTAHGKVDRKALPDVAGRDEAVGFEPPRNEVEEVLAAVWSRVLGLEEIGVRDNFFALGGDSIRSLQVVSLARERGLSFTLQDLFSFQTVSELAEHAERTSAESVVAEGEPFEMISAEDRRRVEQRVPGAEDAYPLARLQAGMLLHMTLAPSDPPYHNVDSWRLRARFHARALEVSLDEVARRHPALRTSFHLEGFSEPLQVVHADVAVPFGVADLRGLVSAAQEREIRRYVRAEKRRLFDFTHAPQLRFFIHRCGETAFQLTVTENHAILDGWSLHATLEEIFARYLDRIAVLPMQPKPMPPPPRLTFRQFVRAEREMLASVEVGRVWDRLLEGASLLVLPPLPSALDRREPRVRKRVFQAPPAVTTGLRRFAREAAVPIKSLVLAAHLRVLSAWGGTTDVMTGLVANGRPEVPEGTEVRGLFLNSLPLRLDLGGGTWSDLARTAFRAERDLVPTRLYPLAVLQQRHGGPLFEVLFNYIHFHVVEGLLRTGEIEVLSFDGREGTNYPLQVVFTPGHLDRGVQVTLEYDSYRLSASQIEQLGGMLSTALAAMAENPMARYEELCLLNAAERQQTVIEWNSTARNHGEFRPIHELIVERASRTPEAVALSFEDGHLSYGELERRSERLAALLRRLGVGPERLVAVALERSLELPLALVSVLRAGGAYVPVDPEYPAERQAWMLEDSGVKVVLTTRRLAAVLPASGLRVIALDGPWEASAPTALEPMPPSAPESLAYAIFTSGSTGRPKGAMNSHRAIWNRLLWMQEAYRLGAADTVAQKTPASFDVSVWEFFWPLMTGARLALARPGGHRDGAYLARFLVEEQVTTMHFVPSMLRAFLDEPEADGCLALRRVVASGEALPPDLVARFFARFGALGTELENLYGPTEAAVDVTFHSCVPEAAVVPIGRPIANLAIHLLDAHGRSVLQGVPGELFIGGVGVGRGYLGRTDLTVERFVPDPFAGELVGREGSGSRLYRTGDLARHLPNGAIEYLGRIDHQVKIRGIRIELGEIEAALAARPEIAAVVVVATRGALGDSRLAAYLVPRQPALLDDPVASRTLRESLVAVLRARLPEAMVPADWVFLPAFPLGPSGKLDRRALPSPEAARVGDPGSGAPPQTPTEEVLSEIWSLLLGREAIARDQSFFDLGGHSLLATQVASRIRATFDVEIPLPRVFDHPTLGGLAAVIDRARAEKRGTSSPPLEPISRGHVLPLSFAQERLWFLDRLEPGSPAYNIPVVARLSGPLEPAALGAAVAEVLRRHESLRTTFALVGAKPTQRIAAASRFFRLSTLDISALPEARREATLRVCARREALSPFDLERGPLVRAFLARLGEEEHALLLTLHHIVSDGWSMGVLLRELGALYSAACAGRPSPLAELAIQYADFVAWQRAWLRDEALTNEVDYWREQLAGLPPLGLPTDRTRPPVPSLRGGARSLLVSSALRTELAALGRAESATLFMTVAAIFQALLSRMTGQQKIAVGTPIAGRTRAELEPLIGFFVNTLVLAGDLTGAPSFRIFLGRLRSAALGAYAHQDLPFEKVVEELQPERDLSRTPLFQAMVQLQNAATARNSSDWAGIDLKGLRLATRPPETTVAKFDLTLAAAERPEGLAVTVEYASDLFDATTVKRLLDHLHTLLEAAVTSPDRPLADLPLLGVAERHQIEIEWMDIASRPLEHATISARIARMAEARPDVVAVHLDGVHLTYGELDRRSTLLAEKLARDFGIEAESIVGLCLSRTPSLLVGLLAIWKAGGAYLPLDPVYPRERLAFMLADSGASLLLSESLLAARIFSTDGEGSLPAGLRVLDPDGVDRPERSGNSSRPGPPDETVLSRLAYVIYTSGSTGRPKGVAISHGALANFLDSMAERPGLDSRDALLAVTSLSFDIAGLELWLTLLAGARLELADGDEAADGLRLHARLRESGATVMQATPATWRLLLDAGWDGVPPLRVLVGGEALPERLAAELTLRSDSVWNLYGPTETTIWSAIEKVDPAIVTIGRPIANTRLSIVDPAGATTPIGIPGELRIGRAGVARGYLGRFGLTAEKFVPDPFRAEEGTPGERLYRTGDLARFRSEGTIEFLGRIDHQVKVRGFRIELGEIEAALEAIDGIVQAVAVAQGEGAERRLIAYLRGPEVGAPSGADLRRKLGRTMPDYMIPSVFVRINAFPLTPNGKVDRRALPALAREVTDIVTSPRTATEARLAAIWESLLGIEGVGVESHFFELGGHSLLAAQLVLRVREAFEVELPLRRVFEAPRLGAFASLIGAEVTAQPRVVIPRVARSERLPLSFAQERLWFLHRLAPESAAYNLPVVLRLRGQLSVPSLAASLAAIVRRHEVLRTTYVTDSEGPRQRIAPAAEAKRIGRVAVIDLARLADSARPLEADRLVVAEGRRPFRLDRGPVLRVGLLRLGAREHIGMLNLHHIASDAWSSGLLVSELSAGYAAALGSGTAELRPPLPIQVVDFAAWQKGRLASAALEAEIAWWRESLSGLAPLELPADRPRPPAQSFRGAVHRFVWPADLGGLVEAEAGRTGATPFMILLAAFDVLLARLSGSTDFAVGTPIAGRTHLEIEPLIGVFVNTLVLRALAPSELLFRSLVERIRETSLDAFAHQEIPFELLVDALQPERSLARNPLFQVMFGLQNARSGTLALPGLALEPYPVGAPAAQFDLELTMVAEPGRLVGSLTIATDLFDLTTAERWVGHLRTLLEGALAAPEMRLDDLPLLGRQECQQILVEWNASAVSVPFEKRAEEIVFAGAERTPDSIAVAEGGAFLTYAKLALRAGRAAAHLIGLGVGSETVVALLAERSPEFLVAILAIWAAGGAYLPLDPLHPPRRWAQVLGRARTPLVIASADFATPLGEAFELLDGSARPATVDISALLTDEPSDPSRRQRSRGELAYAIFTSGSTGVPKGALVEHRGLLNHLFAKLGELGLSRSDVIAQTATQSFDISVWQFLAALLVGGRVEIFADRIARDPGRLLAEVMERGITIVETVPSVLRFVLDEVDRGEEVPSRERANAPGLRWMIPTGEALPPDLARRWLDRFPAIPLLNAYGPTECSDDVSHHRLGTPPAAGTISVPIGRPVANTALYVLDRARRPQPIGIAGEIAVGGAGVGRGYLFEPAKTAEAFQPDPFTAVPGTRLYATGDLGRFLADGTLQFLGRIDHQVKVRGYRIELGEIEAILAEHEAIASAVVLARPHGRFGMQLFAYLVAIPGVSLDVAVLRADLERRLPEPMIPAAFVVLDALPLLPSGKIDRRALPAPELADAPSRAAYEAPQGAMEELIAAIWGEVLGIERVGVRDSFFDLGGHSLLATQVAARLGEALGIEVALQLLFERPTVAGLASALGEESGDAQGLAEAAALALSLANLSDDEVARLLAERAVEVPDGREAP